MILEGLVTTIDIDGRLNLAPMGPEVFDAELRRLVLKPFVSSTTLENLRATRVGVFHVTDDSLMLARAAIGIETGAILRPADFIEGWIISSACRYREFRVLTDDGSEPRPRLEAETVGGKDLRHFLGWNRARHAVLEAAILATRVGLLPWDDLLAEVNRLKSPVDKTGGPDELLAYNLLAQHIETAARVASSLNHPRKSI